MRRVRQVLVALLLLEFLLTVGCAGPYAKNVPCPAAQHPTWEVSATVIQVYEIGRNAYETHLITDGGCKMVVLWYVGQSPYHGLRLRIFVETDPDGTIRIMGYGPLVEV